MFAVPLMLQLQNTASGMKYDHHYSKMKSHWSRCFPLLRKRYKPDAHLTQLHYNILVYINEHDTGSRLQLLTGPRHYSSHSYWECRRIGSPKLRAYISSAYYIPGPSNCIQWDRLLQRNAFSPEPVCIMLSFSQSGGITHANSNNGTQTKMREL
jgi:hypothetical protein